MSATRPSGVSGLAAAGSRSSRMPLGAWTRPESLEASRTGGNRAYASPRLTKSSLPFRKGYANADGRRDGSRGSFPGPPARPRSDVVAAGLLRVHRLPALAHAAADAAREAADDHAAFEDVRHVERRRRTRGGQRGAAGGRRLPARAKAFRATRCPRAERPALLRSARYRQDADGEGR